MRNRDKRVERRTEKCERKEGEMDEQVERGGNREATDISIRRCGVGMYFPIFSVFLEGAVKMP